MSQIYLNQIEQPWVLVQEENMNIILNLCRIFNLIKYVRVNYIEKKSIKFLETLKYLEKGQFAWLVLI